MASVSIQTPNAAATVHPGDAVEIRWTSQGARLHDVTLDVDGTTESLAKGLAGGVRSHVWTVPPELLKARVRAEVSLRVVAHGESDRAEATTPTLTVVPRRTASVPPPSRTRLEVLAIASIDPKMGPVTGGTKLVVHGKGFQPFSIARVGGRDASTTFVDATTLHVLAPATPAAGLVDVVVMNPMSMATAPNAFRYDAVPPPEIRAVDPKQGSTSGGVKLTIVGARFAPTTTVTFAGVRPLRTAFVDATTIEILTPSIPTPGLCDVSVTNVDGQSATMRNAFRCEPAPPPQISNVVPRRGKRTGGERVTILGSSFAPGVLVSLGDATAPSIRFVDATTLEIETPATSQGVFDVRVRNPDGQTAINARGYQAD